MSQWILHHSHPSVTLRYNGITEEETNNGLKAFSVYTEKATIIICTHLISDIERMRGVVKFEVVICLSIYYAWSFIIFINH